jgi:hypothetical protein
VDGDESKIRFKRIQLAPSEFELDVWIVDEPRRAGNEITEIIKRSLSIKMSEEYGMPHQYYYDELLPDCNYVTAHSGIRKGMSGGTTRILMVINPDLQILVHELVHVLWYLSEHAKVKLTYESQEWQALMTDYLFNEIYEFDKLPKR